MFEIYLLKGASNEIDYETVRPDRFDCFYRYQLCDSAYAASPTPTPTTSASAKTVMDKAKNVAKNAHPKPGTRRRKP